MRPTTRYCEHFEKGIKNLNQSIIFYIFANINLNVMNFVDKIKKAIETRNWTVTKANDSWSVFKIMSEFVNGYETL